MVKARSILFFLIILLFSSCTTTEKVDNIQKARAHYQLGVSYSTDNKFQMAYVEFQKALELNPNDKEAWNALGLVYIAFEDFQKAKESFKKAVAIDPNFSEAYNNLGVTHSRMGNWSDAVSAFKAALKNPLYRAPERAYNNLGEAYYRLGRIDDAINAYKEAVKRNLYPSYYGLALCYNAKGQYGDAATAMTQAIEFDPSYRGDKKKLIEDLKNRNVTARGEEKKDIADYLEILKY